MMQTDTEPTAYTTEPISVNATNVTVSAPIEPGAWYQIGSETVMVSHFDDRHQHAGIIRAFAGTKARYHATQSPLYRQRITGAGVPQ